MDYTFLHIFPWLDVAGLQFLHPPVLDFGGYIRYNAAMFRILDATLIFLFEVGRPRAQELVVCLSPEILTILEFLIQGHNLVVASECPAHPGRVGVVVQGQPVLLFGLQLSDHE